MKAEDKYLLGMLWKFGTIKPGTNQFVFQSYDKYEQMEYIRKRLAPDKIIKISTRKDPRSGVEKTLYRLNFTNADWADKVRMYEGTKAEKIIDKEFLRGFLETKGNIRRVGYDKGYCVSINSNNEFDIVSKKLAEICDISLSNGVKSGTSTKVKDIRYGKSDTIKIITTFSPKNPKHWGEVLKKMNPDD